MLEQLLIVAFTPKLRIQARTSISLDAFVLVDVVVPDVALVLVDELEVLVVGALVMLDQQLLEAAQGDVPAWL